MMKLWVRHDSGTHKQTHTHTHTHKHGKGKLYMTFRLFMDNLVLCTLSVNTLYLCPVLPKYMYFKGFRVTGLNSRVYASVVANVKRRTCGRTNGLKTGSLYHTMSEAYVTMKNEPDTNRFH